MKMKNTMKMIGLVAVLGSTVFADQQNTEQKSATEKHKEAIAEQTQRWILETKEGAPSQERMEQIIAENRQKIEKIWVAEQVKQKGRAG